MELTDWITAHLARLRRQGKLHLADQIQYAQRLYFSQHDPTSAYQEAINTAHAAHEAAWASLLSFYNADVTIWWRGDMTRGLRALTRAYQALPDGHLLGDHLLEAILWAWLDVDHVAYGPRIRAVLATITPRSADLHKRLRLLMIFAQPDAAQLARLIPALDWEQPYLDALRATLHTWREDYPQAVHFYEKALKGFATRPIDAAHTLATLAELAHTMGQPQRARAWAQTLLKRQMVSHADRARTLHTLAQCDPAHARHHLTEALAHLEGRGWLRLEAEVAIALYRHDPTARARAETAAARLRSDDLTLS